MADLSRLQVRKNDSQNTWVDVGNKAGNESLPVNVSSLPLPSGASTSAKQDEIIAKLASYSTNNIDEASATVTYIGKEDADGAWLIMKIDESTNPTAFTYATVLNNPTLTSYALGWAGRTTATYGTYAEVF